MQLGDKVLYYHSNIGLAIVGIAEVIKCSYQDPTTNDENWVAVSLVPYRAFLNPVTLAEIKNNVIFRNMELIKQSRLSVSKVTDEEYVAILALGGIVQ